jgi:hypothetical protein
MKTNNLSDHIWFLEKSQVSKSFFFKFENRDEKSKKVFWKKILMVPDKD